MKRYRNDDPLCPSTNADAIVWRGTGTPPTPVDGADDFVAEWRDYTLRVERMSEGVWWWAMYPPGETWGVPGATAGNFHWSVCDGPLTNMRSRVDAMRAAEISARIHERLTSRPPIDLARHDAAR